MSYFSSSRIYTLPHFCLRSQTSQRGYNVDVLSPEHEAAPWGASVASYQHCPPSLCHWLNREPKHALLTPCPPVPGRQRCAADAVLPSWAVAPRLSVLPFTVSPLPQKEMKQLFHICKTSRRPMWNVLNAEPSRSYAERMQYFPEENSCKNITASWFFKAGLTGNRFNSRTVISTWYIGTRKSN